MLKKISITIIITFCLLGFAAPVFAGSDTRSYYDLPVGYNPNHKEFFSVAHHEYQAYPKGDTELFGSAYLNETMQGWPELLGMEMKDAQSYADLLYLVLEIGSYEQGVIKRAFETGEIFGGLKQNVAVQALVQKNDTALLNYLMLVRTLDEKSCFSNRNAWTYKEKQTAYNICYGGALFEQAYRGYADNTDNLELAMRYAYQYMRLCFYNGDYYAALAFYEQELAHKPDSVVKEWCRAFYGGAQFKTGDRPGAFLSFAIVLNRSERYYTQAQESLKEIVEFPYDVDRMFPDAFHEFIYGLDYARRAEQIAAWRSADAEAAVEQVNPYLADKGRERERRYRAEEFAIARRFQNVRNMVLNALLQAQTPEEFEMVKIVLASFGIAPRGYAYLANKTPHDHLLYSLRLFKENNSGTRILEDALINVANWPDFMADDAHSVALYTELEQLAVMAADKRPLPALWYLGVAHFATARGDYNTAVEYLATAKAHSAERDFPLQYAISCAFVEISLGDLSVISQNKFVPLLDKLENFQTKDVALKQLVAHNYDGLLMILAGRYQANGDYAAMFLCLSILNENESDHNSRYYDPIPRWTARWATKDMYDTLGKPAEIAEIMRITQNPATPAERFLAQRTAKVWQAEQLYEMQGRAYIMQFDFAGAQAVFENMRRLQEKRLYTEALTAVVADGFTGLGQGVLGLVTFDQKTERLEFVVAEKAAAEAAERYAGMANRASGNMNPMRDNHDDIFGRVMSEDYNALFFTSMGFGLSDDDVMLLVEITDTPKDFLDFTQKMQHLHELSLGENELAAMAGYFYGKGLRNIYKQANWYYGYHRWPQDKVDIIIAQLEQALAKAANPELKARLYFLLGAVNWHIEGLRQSDYSNYDFPKPKEFEDTGSFMQYYEALRDYGDTYFGHEALFNCSTLKMFLKRED